jgi:UDP-N-acetylmuramate: L-alanyl-gamma-D-glutamyl-meso-diaminopimelate ligase
MQTQVPSPVSVSPKSTSATHKIAIVSVSGVLQRTPEFLRKREEDLKTLGLDVQPMLTEFDSDNGCSSGTALERAVLLCHALTNRKYQNIWAARGGMGVTEIVPHLENMLPPVLPTKTLIGFSDISFLGCYLASKYPNLKYIHATHAYDPILLQGSPELDRRLLFSLIKQEKPSPLRFPLEKIPILPTQRSHPHSFQGPIVPLNLSLAESFCTLPGAQFPMGTLLFIEDLWEDVYRILRKFDSLFLSGLMQNVQALVLGQFTKCNGPDGSPISVSRLAELLTKRFRIPVFQWEAFGHEEWRLPLVYGAQAQIEQEDNANFLTVSFEANVPEFASARWEPLAERIPQQLNSKKKAENEKPRLHMTGIGGTGMAAVAGLFSQKGFEVTGSDTPIYPPMDETLRAIGITPYVQYKAEHLQNAKPDMLILANAISRRNAELQPNEEFQALLQDSLPLYSFPSALRHFFLKKSRNVVVSGTHGKTTTTSLLAHLFEECKHSPSFLIGGTPLNFASGFRFSSDKLFVLEGDEYDTALFDKGPKFLHYEASIALINNIEFDHADIYSSLDAIVQEFRRLARACSAKRGWVVANVGCPRARKIGLEDSSQTLFFGTSQEYQEAKAAGFQTSLPCWELINAEPNRSGQKLTLRAPNGIVLHAPAALFGSHNARNATAALACLHAYALLEGHDFLESEPLQQAVKSFQSFKGVKRRFEHIGTANEVAVFDDFAHHPTAIHTTLGGFRDYVISCGAPGRLIACFDPRNATMRRNILQEPLSQSFGHADAVFLGRVARDKRIPQAESMNAHTVAAQIGAKAQAFEDNLELKIALEKFVKPGDTVVFMSSGSFDNLPRLFFSDLQRK